MISPWWALAEGAVIALVGFTTGYAMATGRIWWRRR